MHFLPPARLSSPPLRRRPTRRGQRKVGSSSRRRITPLFKHELPNVPGKALLAAEVLFPPGAASPSYTHPKSAFIYAYVLSGEVISAVDEEKPHVFRAGESWHEAPGAHHLVTRNPSETTAA